MDNVFDILSVIAFVWLLLRDALRPTETQKPEEPLPPRLARIRAELKADPTRTAKISAYLKAHPECRSFRMAARIVDADAG